MKRGPRESDEQGGASRPSSRLLGGTYEVLEEIGESWAGTTYRVRHTLLDTVVSLTLLPAEVTADQRQCALIRDAVRRASALRHEHIAPVLDAGQEANRLHVVEGFADGELLDRLLRESGPLSPAEALRVARQLADALAYAHERGMIHGALRPTSVWIRRDAPPRAMLCGFATAAVAFSPGALVPYVAPERLLGKDVDARSDVFGVGLLLFEMLEGKPLLSGAQDEMTDALLHRTEPLLPRFSRIVPAGLSSLIARAIRRAPADRQQSMGQLRAEIDACLQRLGQRDVEARRRPSAKPSRRMGIVVDEAIERLEEGATLTPVPAHAGGPPAAKPVAKVKAAVLEPTVGRVLTAGPPARRSRRRSLHVAGALIAVAAILALLRPRVLPTAAAPEQAPVALETSPPDRGAPAAPVEPSIPAAQEAPVVPAPADAAADDAGPEVAPALAAETVPTAVRNLAPRIVSYRPRERGAITVMEGAAVAFSAQAADRNPEDRLAYAWFVDGREAARGQSWRFVAPPAATQSAHTIEVRVSDGSGLNATPVSWTVEVTPRMTEANVHDWIGRFASAWERGDLATLRLYGVVTGEADARAIRKRLPRDADARVTITNETIELEGRYATVAFDLAEFENSKLRSSRRESYRLEKRPNGFIGLRPRTN